MINLCTFTALDVRTDLNRVVGLSEAYPFLEFGILLTRSPEDKDERYPLMSEITQMVDRLAGKTRLALHVCGHAVREFVAGTPDIEELVSAGIGRVQLNFNLKRGEFGIDELEQAIVRCPADVITQHFPANSALATSISAKNHHVLYDTSGGNGIAPERYEPPFEGKYTGYAGGIGPENVLDVARAMRAVKGEVACWIDMESRVRTDGYLDLTKCEMVADALAPIWGA